MPLPPAAAAAGLALTLLLAGACSGDASGDPVEGGKSQVLGDADEGIDGVQAVRVYYSTPVHTSEDGEIPYELRPPAGGMHRPVWWNCGFYDQPIPDENAVHDLEHGAVWLAYSPDLDAAEVEMLHLLVRSNDKILAVIDPAEVTAARAKIPSLQHGRRFEVIEPMAEPTHLHAVRGPA